MSDLETEDREKENLQDSKADAIAALLVIVVLTTAMYIWVSSQQTLSMSKELNGKLRVPVMGPELDLKFNHP